MNKLLYKLAEFLDEKFWMHAEFLDENSGCVWAEIFGLFLLEFDV